MDGHRPVGVEVVILGKPVQQARRGHAPACARVCQRFHLLAFGNAQRTKTGGVRRVQLAVTAAGHMAAMMSRAARAPDSSAPSM